MATSEEEENYSECEEGSDYSDCDSDMDPTYSLLEETQSQLSNLSIHKKSKSRLGKVLEIERDPEEDYFKIIESGKLEKLKVEQCKVYLRKNGLRLTGNKDTLIQRIKEHQEILNGGGEKKYPISSFVLNCKGDACTGDIVMFEQNVYEMFNIASRSASGPPCGTRIVAGRIVKESYGAAKQQHTFTIEVLWSKGEKPLPPLHPLLIKGRNLYRLKTMRQRWEDEEERRKVLIEKHSRGSLARDARETRVQEKERRKMLRENRALKKQKINKNQFQLNSSLEAKKGTNFIQAKGSHLSSTEAASGTQEYLSIDSGKMRVQRNESGSHDDPGKLIEALKSGMPADAEKVGDRCQNLTSRPLISRTFADGVKADKRPLQPAVRPQMMGSSIDIGKTGGRPQQLATKNQQPGLCTAPIKPTNRSSQESGFPEEIRKLTFQLDQPKYQKHNLVYDSGILEVQQHNSDDFRSRSPSFYMNDHHHPIDKYPRTAAWENGCSKGHNGRQPLTSINHYHGDYRQSLCTNSYRSINSLNRQQQLCKFYAQGRCKFGDDCKFLHELTENCGQRREDRPYYHSRLEKRPY